MEANKPGGKVLDPRTGMFLLLCANIVTFFQNFIIIEAGWIGFLIVMIALSGHYKRAFQWLFYFIMLILLQYIILPSVPGGIAMGFVIMVNYSRRMFACLMTGDYMLKNISLPGFCTAMRKLHVPQKLIIPISVTMRYFPSIREEAGYIKDAMRLRNIRLWERPDTVIVPLMMAATVTAEELSAAAVTRGVENPVRKTSIIRLHMGVADYLCMSVAAAFAAAAIVLK